MKRGSVFCLALMMVLCMNGFAGATLVKWNPSDKLLSEFDYWFFDANDTLSITFNFINSEVNWHHYDADGSSDLPSSGTVSLTDDNGDPIILNFNPATQDISSAFIKLFVWDDLFPDDMSGSDYQESATFTYYNNGVAFDIDNFSSSPVEFQLNGAGLADINNDGEITFNLGATAGDFIFGALKMDVNIVPIPTAAWLFGTGILALIGIRRKFA